MEYFFVFTGEGTAAFLVIWLLLSMVGVIAMIALRRDALSLLISIICVVLIALVLADLLAFLCCGW